MSYDQTRTLGELAQNMTVTSGGQVQLVTQPNQFDSTLNVATTGFVQQAVGNFASIVKLTATGTLTASQTGSFVEITGGSGITITLPAPTTANLSFTFFNSVAGASTLSTPSGNIYSANNAATTFPLSVGSTVEIVSDGTNWIVLSGQGTGALVSNGYQKFPSGFIIQWGTLSITGGTTATTLTFPVAFPTGCLALELTYQSSVQYTGTAVFMHNAIGQTVSASTFVNQSSGSFNTSWLAVGH
jgi:hypothetical protein